MKSQHTPGPWVVSVDVEGLYVSCRQRYKYVCDIEVSNPAYAKAESAITKAEALANAQLIAAAPEMLAVLEEARLLLEGNGGSDCDISCTSSNCVCLARRAAILTRAETAIAKAKGESK